MRKVLFASTALVAFGVAGAAQAADPITLKVGGFMHQWWGWAEQGSDTVAGFGPVWGNGQQNNVVNRSNTEIFFTGSTKLDNGMTVAVRVELEGGSDGATSVDESNLTLSGGFGRLILGGEDDVISLFANRGPSVGYGYGFVENFWAVQPSAFTHISYPGAQDVPQDNSDAQKITYITPSLAGFQLGASYTPHTTDTTGTDPAGFDAYAAALSYNNKFGDVGLKLDFGVFNQNGTVRSIGGGTSVGQLSGWRAGANVSFAGFTLGGAYMKQKDDTAANEATTPVRRDGKHYNIGLAYETGPFGVSLGYARETTEGLVTNAADDKFTQWELAGKYILGPGIDVALSLSKFDFDDELAGNSNNNDAWVAVTGVRVAF